MRVRLRPLAHEDLKSQLVLEELDLLLTPGCEVCKLVRRRRDVEPRSGRRRRDNATGAAFIGPSLTQPAPSCYRSITAAQPLRSNHSFCATRGVVIVPGTMETWRPSNWNTRQQRCAPSWPTPWPARRLVYSKSLAPKPWCSPDIIWSHLPQIDSSVSIPAACTRRPMSSSKNCNAATSAPFRVVYPNAQALERLVRRAVERLLSQPRGAPRVRRVRKVEPFKRAIAGFSAWITGVRRDSHRPVPRPGAGVGTRSTDCTKSVRSSTGGSRGMAVHPRAPAAVQSPARSPVSSIGCSPCTRAIQLVRAAVPAAGGGSKRSPRMWPASESASAPCRPEPGGGHGLSAGVLRLHARPVVVVAAAGGAAQGAVAAQGGRARDSVAPQLHPELGQRAPRGAHACRRGIFLRTARACGRGRRRDGRSHGHAAVAAPRASVRVPVNVVDDAELSSLHLPAIIDRSPIVSR